MEAIILMLCCFRKLLINRIRNIHREKEVFNQVKDHKARYQKVIAL